MTLTTITAFVTRWHVWY